MWLAASLLIVFVGVFLVIAVIRPKNTFQLCVPVGIVSILANKVFEGPYGGPAPWGIFFLWLALGVSCALAGLHLGFAVEKRVKRGDGKKVTIVV